MGRPDADPSEPPADCPCDGQQIFVTRHRKETQAADILHRPDKAEVALAGFQIAG
jgi:hypothetical protein